MSKGSDKTASNLIPDNYNSLIGSIRSLVETARHSAARSVNALMTATYWEIGRRIVEFEQGGSKRAGYGQELLKRLAGDLRGRFGRGFAVDNLQRMRGFYLAWDLEQIYATVSRKSLNAEPPLQISRGSQTQSAKSAAMSRNFKLSDLTLAFPLPWSHYVRLLAVKNAEARSFYETEALRGGWSVRQLDRQIASLFYERIALSKNKANMLVKSAKATTDDSVTAEEELKDPFVLEFLDLKDEYSESDLEEELGGNRFDSLTDGLCAFLGRIGRDTTHVKQHPAIQRHPRALVLRLCIGAGRNGRRGVSGCRDSRRVGLSDIPRRGRPEHRGENSNHHQNNAEDERYLAKHSRGLCRSAFDQFAF